MIRDLLQDTPNNNHSDVCVVGAGAAGIVLALELAGKGKRVTLLDGGGKMVEQTSQQPYASVCAGLPHRGLHDGRVRVLGGTTTMWGGQILELDTLDFERRAWVAGSGWPFSKSELSPYYRRALELEGIAGSMLDDTSVWNALGIKTPVFDPLQTYLSRWCPEPDFAKLHRTALDKGFIDVWVHANAVQLLLDGDQALGVRCRTQTGLEVKFTADEYVFCLGAIESSRFFLQPHGGQLPWNASGLLGRHFQDHIDCTAATLEPLPGKRFHDSFDAIFLSGYKYNPKVKLDSAAQENAELLQVGATFFSESDTSDTLPGIKNTARNVLRGRFEDISRTDALQLFGRGPSLLRHGFRYAMQHRAYHPAKAQMKMRVHCEQEPTSSSTLTLADCRDDLGLLRTRLAWRISHQELRTIRTFVNIAKEALRDVARVVPDQSLSSRDDEFVTRCEDSYHHMGGMRMDVSERYGVVDPSLRLHGMRNVYVCSSAVFPTSGFSNPTHTLLALAVRLAEHLGK